MNWGEPWYAGFRESQTEYRLKNQGYFQRNFMPPMLGWFSMRNNTPIEDIEWMLARSAAYGAGYAFVTGKEQLKTNGHAKEILKAIGEWEKARMGGAFTEEQKEKMKDINNEFHLVSTGNNTWNLFPLNIFRFEHGDKIRQPGEPLYSTFEFDNSVEKGTLNFIVSAHNASVSEIAIEINNSIDIKIPVKLNRGESLRYSGGESAGIYDTNLQIRENVELDSSLFKLNKGKQTVNFDCIFSNKNEDAKAIVEIRILDKPEVVKSSK
jgi:hypothetical protein